MIHFIYDDPRFFRCASSRREPHVLSGFNPALIEHTDPFELTGGCASREGSVDLLPRDRSSGTSSGDARS